MIRLYTFAAKVPPQRQVTSQPEIQRDNVAIVGGQGQLIQQQQQASLFLQQQQQAHRASPVTATSSNTVQTESRSQERVASYSHPSYQTVNPTSSDLSAYYQQAYQNLMYSPLAAVAQAQALVNTSLAGGTTIRPSGIGKNFDGFFAECKYCLNWARPFAIQKLREHVL